MPTEPRQTQFWGIFASIAAVVAVFIAVVGAYAGNGGTTVQADAPPIEVTLGDMYIQPAAISAPGGRVILEVTNEGAATHDLVVEELGESTPMLNPGESYTLDLGVLEPGVYTVFCSVPGHRGAGMEGTLTVSDGQAVAAGVSHADHRAEKDWQKMDADMTASMEAFPAETAGKGGELLEYEVDADGTKVFRLTAEIADWEVEPGKVVQAWTYNGVVPAPTIRTEIGDRVRIHLQNDLPMSTEIHWHGIRVPFEMDGVAPLTQPFVEPGESYTYEFVTDHYAVGMYHPHHHGYEKIPNGMLGAFLVGDTPLPEGVEIAQEYPMVLNDAGVIGMALNGKSWPATEPVVANQGDYILVHYFNEGVMAHPMHLHEAPQLIVAKDGFPLDVPYYADTVNVAPGERYTVLIEAAHVGVWAWHCHILTHAENAEGLYGMVTAFIVNE
jgi:manganese oxidase